MELPQDKRRVYVLLGGVLVLAFLSVAFFTTRPPEPSAAAPSSPALPTKAERRTIATDLTKAARTKTEERVVRPSYGALLTNMPRERTAAESVMLSIKTDEAQRAVLVEEKEMPDAFSYTYRISAPPEMEAHLQQLCTSTAQRNGLNPQMLRMELDKELRSYLIPAGQERVVRIIIPKETGTKVTYMTGLQAIGSPLSSDRLQTRQTETGLINISHNHPTRWRFDHLMELREPE